MKTKLIGFCVMFLVCASTVPLFAESGTSNGNNAITSNTPSGEIEVLSNDLLRYIENKESNNGRLDDPTPGYYDTSEYLIGSVGIGLIFLESNGAIDPSTENWNTTETNNVQSQITQAISWWINQNQWASLSYVLDVHTAVPTSYEPIIHPSAMTDPTYEKLWVSEAMASLGYSSGDWMKRTRDYVNAMRTAKGTDWGLTVFLVDSSNDVGGDFSDGYFAYAYMGGPYIVMTYDNDGWGISAMNQVMAHETGHIFWATDEYDGYTEFSGYLNAADVEGSGCLMDTNFLSLSAGTRLQVGWRDTDLDNILDIIDTNPDTILNPYPQDPTPLQILTYTGVATEVPYQNNNPQPGCAGNDVSINNIMVVFYRIDGGPWNPANPGDGNYDEAMETYTFTTIPIPHGTHLIETFAMNNVGNVDPTLASDTITIDNPPNIPTLTGTVQGKTGQQYMYNGSTVDVDGDPVYYWFDWDDGTNTGWLGPLPPGATMNVNHSWSTKGTYEVKVKAKDIYGMESSWATLDVTMPKNAVFDGNFFRAFLQAHPFLSSLLSFLFERFSFV
ncbi:MAG TPA: PKD domain-containing protein [Candidatus Thermoplasmatota archaeon]|nr:PKD domain-containing protein [Candidatus Thermoplasmatota archaeon]